MECRGTNAWTHESELEPLQPSAKLIYYVLAREEPLSVTGVVEQTLLSERTVRDVLDQLERREVVRRRIDVTDARRRLYRLAEPPE